MRRKIKISDRILVIASLVYVLLPFVIFCLGFLKFYIAFPASAFIAWAAYKCYDSFEYMDSESSVYSLIGVGFILVGVLLVSGIGEFGFQEVDFYVRNPIFKALVEEKWPLCIDLSRQTLEVREDIGADIVGFSYYFTYWLPAALFGKITSMAYANMALLLWTFLGLFILILNISRITKMDILFLAVIMFFFAQPDIVGALLNGGNRWTFQHWNPVGIYEGFVASLFLVFNQALPCWVIVVLILRLKDLRNLAFVASVLFSYSPWCTIGIFPICLYMVYHKKSDFLSVFTIQNVCMPLIVFITMGTLYMANDSEMVKGFIWNFHSSSKLMLLMPLLWIVNYTGYLAILYNRLRTDKIIIVCVIVLFVYSFYQITGVNDFLMRTAIPLLFILFVYVIDEFMKSERRKRFFILGYILVCAYVPYKTLEYHAVMSYFFPEKCRQWVGTVEHIECGDKEGNVRYARVFDRQFFVHNYNDKFFYKYLAK